MEVHPPFLQLPSPPSSKDTSLVLSFREPTVPKAGDLFLGEREMLQLVGVQSN